MESVVADIVEMIFYIIGKIIIKIFTLNKANIEKLTTSKTMKDNKSLIKYEIDGRHYINKYFVIFIGFITSIAIGGLCFIIFI